MGETDMSLVAGGGGGGGGGQAGPPKGEGEVLDADADMSDVGTDATARFKVEAAMGQAVPEGGRLALEGVTATRSFSGGSGNEIYGGAHGPNARPMSLSAMRFVRSHLTSASVQTGR